MLSKKFPFPIVKDGLLLVCLVNYLCCYNDYERFHLFFKEIVENPDYIIEANKPNTALILKEIKNEQEQFKAVLRLATSSDDIKYKNSIITFMKIDDKEWTRLLKNKKILYKSE